MCIIVATVQQSWGMATEENTANTFRAIIATDNHLGYLEKDPIRGQDSFVAFEEIFKEAIKRKAMMWANE